MYNETVTRLFQQPYHQGSPQHSDVCGQAGMPGEGPYLRLFLSIEGERILEAHFETYGCPSAVACGSWVCRWVEGRSLNQVTVLDADSLMKVLGGLPLGKDHTAQLAVRALHAAIAQASDQST